MRTVEGLRHGGIMANYRCNAACRHCMYACSPGRSGGYITKAAAEEVCALLTESGCYSVHIGGGEPFLDFNGLLDLVRIVNRAGISIEYVETNAFWADDGGAANLLRDLMRAGADTLCISVDPFHAEYVPVKMPLKLAEICRATGFQYFLWQERFLQHLSKRDGAYSRRELERTVSPDYIIRTAKSYGIRMGGRAINIEAEYTKHRPASTFLDSHPCRGLLSSGHFHTDVYGNYIPPGCTGIIIPLKEAVRGIPDGKYPAFESIMTGGLAGLMRFAQSMGFEADPQGYPSGCALCFHIRRWLSINAQCPELDAEHYSESLKYYD